LTLTAAIDGFVARRDLAAATTLSYTKMLRRLAREIGGDRPLAGVAHGELARGAEQL